MPGQLLAVQPDPRGHQPLLLALASASAVGTGRRPLVLRKGILRSTPSGARESRYLL